MSDTFHHHQPGTPRTPGKQPIPTGRADTKRRTLMSMFAADLDTRESMKVRRTR